MAAPTSLKDTHVVRFSPAGTSDSLDATDEFPGACALLTNLVPDLRTRNMWTCRPGATIQADFSTWPVSTTAGRVVVCMVVGSLVCGLCTDTGAGSDKPFVYDLVNNVFVTVTIVAGALYPVSVGPQNPVQPTAALIGVTVIFTHPGYTLAARGCTGSISLATPGTPSYTSRDLTGALTFVALGAIPDWVCQFNQRAYYGVNASQPSMVASDVLVPSTVTAAGQALTFGNNLPLTAGAPLGLSNQLGGIIQSLMVFQGAANIQQVTGDFALSTWAVNTLNVATGTTSPRSICSTPLGLAFVAPDGLRIIGQDGNVSEPIGNAGSGVNYPFTLPVALSAPLTCAGCDAVTIRISVTTLSPLVGSEYWYNIVRKVWSGPHGPFISNQYQIWNGTFLCVPGVGVNSFERNLYRSDTNPSATSVFVEDSTTLSFVMQSVVLSDNDQMAESELVEQQFVAAVAKGTTSFMNVSLLDAKGIVIVEKVNLAINPNLDSSSPYPYRVDYSTPAVFNRAAILITGVSGPNTLLGDTYFRMRILGFITNNT